MAGPSFVIGNIAKGEDFWNRHREIENIWKALEKTNVLLKAPRRFGKTTIMFNLYDYPLENFKVFILDTESVRGPEEFISDIVSMILSDSLIRKYFHSVSDFMTGIINRIDEVDVPGIPDIMPDIRISIKEAVKRDWQEEGRMLISHLQKYKGKVLFILDELPVLINNIKRKSGEDTAVDFLNWFRFIRQMPELCHVRWLIGGSIGIEYVIEQVGAGINTINDFEIINIYPFTEIEGRSFMKALLKKEGQIARVETAVLNKLMETIGAPVPYFIQILLRESLYEMQKRNRRSLSDEIIEKAYKEGVLGPASRTYFQHYFSRLKEHYDGDIERIAKRLLLEVARRGKVKRSELFRLFRQESSESHMPEDFSYLMTDLENDFYVSYDGESDSYMFTTKVLRDWWLRYYDLVEV